MKLFNPEKRLMPQLEKLTEKNAKKWYKQYLAYHKGVDQGIFYVIGYFADQNKSKMLQKEFSSLRPN